MKKEKLFLNSVIHILCASVSLWLDLLCALSGLSGSLPEVGALMRRGENLTWA